MYKPKIMYKSFTQEIADQNSEVEELLKAGYKRVSRNGVQYYASGPYAGKKVGTVRGTGTKLSPTKRESSLTVSFFDPINGIGEALDSKGNKIIVHAKNIEGDGTFKTLKVGESIKAKVGKNVTGNFFATSISRKKQEPKQETDSFLDPMEEKEVAEQLQFLQDIGSGKIKVETTLEDKKAKFFSKLERLSYSDDYEPNNSAKIEAEAKELGLTMKEVEDAGAAHNKKRATYTDLTRNRDANILEASLFQNWEIEEELERAKTAKKVLLNNNPFHDSRNIDERIDQFQEALNVKKKKDPKSFSDLDVRAQNLAIIEDMKESPKGKNRPSMEEVRAKLMTSKDKFNRTGIKLDSE